MRLVVYGLECRIHVGMVGSSGSVWCEWRMHEQDVASNGSIGLVWFSQG